MKRYSKQEQALFLKNRKPSQNTISEPHAIPEIMKTYRGHLIEKTLTPLEEKYPYGHPFWMHKPEIEEFNGDYSLVLLDLFQDGHCFLNGLRNTPCHCDSYMTVLDYDAVDKTFKIVQDEYSLPKE